MKAISITLETLNTGTARATGRYNGRTVARQDGALSDSRALLAAVMSKTCYAHRIGNSYDLTCIALNSAAQAVFSNQKGNPT
jgi:hypothetical protein